MTQALEYELEFAQRPDSDSVVLELEFAPGVSFYFQPPLTVEEIAQGCERPENVVGSYAVYYERSGQFLDRDGNEVSNYETGKLAHIYRPFVRDADGKEAWCDQVIDPEAGTLSITMPSAWLDAAAYPVILGPTFGYTSVGGTTHAIGAEYGLAVGPHAPASSGDATSVSVYFSAVASAPAPNVTLGIYDGTPDSRLGDSANAVGVTGWNTLNLDSSVAVTGSTDYYLGCGKDGRSTTWRYDTVAGFEMQYNARTYTSGVLLNPWSADGTISNAKYSIYATYTATTTPSTIELPTIALSL